MTKLLTSTWMTVIISAVVYFAATLMFWKTPVAKSNETPSDPTAANLAAHGPSWEFVNPEADQLIAELKAEKKSLEKKEQQLNDLAVRLQAEHSEISQVTQSVHQLQVEFDSNVLRVKEEETANLKKLAKVYAAMAPDSAAGIMSELDDVAVVKILLFMKDSETAAILEAIAKKGDLQSKRAASISERVRVSAFRGNAAK